MMKRILPMIALLVGATAAVTAQESAGTKFSYHPVEVKKTDKGSLFTMAAEVDGKQKRFLLDTGSARTIIYDVKIAKELGIKLTEVKDGFQGVGGKISSYTGPIKSSTVGKIVQLGKQDSAIFMRVTSLDHLTVDQEEAKISGLIGSPLLKKTRAVFDYSVPKMLIPSGNPPKGLYKRNLVQKGHISLPLLEGKFNYPYLDVVLNGEKFFFLIDTGANANVIQPDVAKSLGLEVQNKNTTIKGAKNTAGVGKVSVKEPLLGGKVQIPSLEFYVIDSSKGLEGPNGEKISGIIGTKILTAIKAKLDYDSYHLLIPKPGK